MKFGEVLEIWKRIPGRENSKWTLGQVEAQKGRVWDVTGEVPKSRYSGDSWAVGRYSDSVLSLRFWTKGLHGSAYSFILFYFFKLPCSKIDFVFMFSSMTYNTCRDSWNYQHYNENTEQSHHPKISLMLSLYSNKLPTSKIWQLPLYFQSLLFYLIENVTSTNRTVCNLLRLASFP